MSTIHDNPALGSGLPGKIIWRRLYSQIDRNSRLIGITGFRGAGKTTFLLDWIQSRFYHDTSVMYVNLNEFSFTNRTLYSLALEFAGKGGRFLFLDQVQKYPGWQFELRRCYDDITGLSIVFSGPSLLLLTSDNPDIKTIAKVYNLEGLSFREFLNYSGGFDFEPLTFSGILENHEALACEIASKTRPLAFYNDYVRFGAFPWFTGKDVFPHDTLLKNLNLTLEIDIPYQYQIDLKYLPKLRKLLFLLAAATPQVPIISRLAVALDTSRTTVMNYLMYLKEASLIRLLYRKNGEEVNRKPAKIYMQNPNFLFSVAPEHTEASLLAQTFFTSQVAVAYPLTLDGKAGFLADEKYSFIVGDPGTHLRPGQWGAIDQLETGVGNRIPLWLFGFLY